MVDQQQLYCYNNVGKYLIKKFSMSILIREEILNLVILIGPGIDLKNELSNSCN